MSLPKQAACGTDGIEKGGKGPNPTGLLTSYCGGDGKTIVALTWDASPNPYKSWTRGSSGDAHVISSALEAQA
jgi:hypothetical protein